jgi:hypothetical protein
VTEVEQTIEMIEQWLASKGVTLWGDWDITRPDRRHQAAEWFMAQVLDFGAFHRNGAPA